MYVEPIHRALWDDVRGEVVTLPEVLGYQAYTKEGRPAGRGGESREAAITSALEASGQFEEKR